MGKGPSNVKTDTNNDYACWPKVTSDWDAIIWLFSSRGWIKRRHRCAADMRQ